VSEVLTTFALTRPELAQAYRVARRHQRDTRAVYMFLALVLILVIGSELIRRDGPRYAFLSIEAFVLFAMAVGLWAHPWMLAKQAKEPIEESWRFSSAGAEVRSALLSTSLSWNAVHRVFEDRRFFLLYVSESLAYPIPKRALSAEQQSALRTGLREWISSRAEVAA
jgi:YcxB-like protein